MSSNAMKINTLAYQEDLQITFSPPPKKKFLFLLTCNVAKVSYACRAVSMNAIILYTHQDCYTIFYFCLRQIFDMVTIALVIFIKLALTKLNYF